MPFIEEQAAQQNAAAVADGTRAGLNAITANAIEGYNCPSRRGPTRHFDATENLTTWLIDYAAANPGPTRVESAGSANSDLPKDFNHLLNDAAWENKTGPDVGFLFNGCDECRDRLDPGCVAGGIRWPNATFRGIVQRSDWKVFAANNVNNCHYGWGRTVKIAQVTDGTSKTMWVSEKRLEPKSYQEGAGWDDRGWTDGWDYDVIRSTMVPLAADTDLPDTATRERAQLSYGFGAAHSGAVNAVFADGSVQSISYEVDRELFNVLAHRDDGEVVKTDAL